LLAIPDPVQVAVEAAEGAGKILRSMQGKVSVEYKGSIDLVTEADRQSESYILSHLQSTFPDHRLIAEESGRYDLNQPTDICWYIDPLDGTTNYSHGLPEYAISIAMVEKGLIKVGVIYIPQQDQLFTARRGEGATLNGRPIRVSDGNELIKAMVATGFSYDVHTNPDNNLDHFCDFVLHAQAVRRIGAAAIDMAYVAAGIFEGYWEANLKPWDYMAGALLVEEAGGQVTDYCGRAFSVDMPNILASNGKLHSDMIRLLNKRRTI
jgi:myo-inositol-1(or 4)-monophosphatase